MRPTRALTLLELLVAVGIVSILATVAAVSFLSAQVRAKVARVRADLAVVVTALEAYRADHGAYPWHRGFGTVGHGGHHPGGHPPGEGPWPPPTEPRPLPDQETT